MTVASKFLGINSTTAVSPLNNECAEATGAAEARSAAMGCHAEGRRQLPRHGRARHGGGIAWLRACEGGAHRVTPVARRRA
mmetsp:Transcript_87735/g.272587  ORF Transcript_87735/g.272587 Transcript_87735/m.272587 type:complete len:81 (+) Transcript_87735:483-725(+)